MKPSDIKEANRLYWIVKGHLIPQEWGEDDVEKILDSYTRRIWGNHEACVHEEGFEEAWEKRNTLNV